MGSLQGSTRSRRMPVIPPWQGPSSLHSLYNLLLAPFDDLLPSSAISKYMHPAECQLINKTTINSSNSCTCRSQRLNSCLGK